MNFAGGMLHAGLQSVLDTALDAVIVIDTNGRVLGWNRKAESTFGWERSEAIGRTLPELIIPKRYRQAHERGLANYLETGEGPVLDQLIEIEGCRKDQQEIKIELSITASDQFGERLFIGFLRDISQRVRLAEQRERLLSEFNHRVKNMLSVVLAIAHQTARNSPDLDNFEKAFTGRLETLARGHDLLIASEWRDVDLASLAKQLLGADAAAGRASFSGEPIQLSANRVSGLVLVLHELYTNAAKYGALATPGGQIDLDWRIEDGEAVVCWRESRLDGVEEPQNQGFGKQMIAMTARADLQGRVEFDWRDDGLVVTIRFPVQSGA